MTLKPREWFDGEGEEAVIDWGCDFVFLIKYRGAKAAPDHV